MNAWRVRRERIVDRLRAASEYPVALVSADAGFGKSIAVRQFLDGIDGYVFYRVPPETGTLLGFLRGLTEALETVVPGAHLSLAMAHERAMQSTAPATELARWFTEHLREASLLLVIDDLHNATAAPIEDFLARSIAAVPQAVRWLIATRRPTTFPIASWLAHGVTDVPLDEEALRFGDDELAELAERVGSPASSGIVPEVMRRSEGRPSAAALALALGEALTDVPPAASPLATYRQLARAVFDAQPAHGKVFLRKTAVFAELDRELLLAAGWPVGVVGDLTGAGAFVDDFGDGRFGYDGLFRAFLLDVLREAGDEREALIEAGVACERVRRFGDALGFYRRAGAHAAGSRILAAHGIALMDAGSADVVEASIDGLDQVEAAGPEIKTLRAILDSQRARFDSAEAWFQLAIHEAPNDDARLMMTYRYALDLLRRGRIDCIELLEPCIASAPPEHELYPLLCATLATAYAVVDRFGEAQTLIRSAIGELQPTLPDAMRSRAYHQMAYVALRCADTAEARTYAQRVLEIAVPGGLFDLAARAHSILYEIAHAWEPDPREALEHVERVAAFGLKAGDAQIRQWALLAAYYIEAERGNSLAMSAIERSLNAAEVLQTTDETTAALLPGQALRATWSGDFSHAFRLLANTAETQVSRDRRALRWAEIALFATAAGLLHEGRTATAAARTELDGARAGKHSAQAAAYLLVALALQRDPMTWITVRGVTPITEGSAAIAALIAAANALHDHWLKKRDHIRVLAAMEELREQYLGGVALMFEALPAGPIAAVEQRA